MLFTEARHSVHLFFIVILLIFVFNWGQQLLFPIILEEELPPVSNEIQRGSALNLEGFAVEELLLLLLWLHKLLA